MQSIPSDYVAGSVVEVVEVFSESVVVDASSEAFVEAITWELLELSVDVSFEEFAEAC